MTVESRQPRKKRGTDLRIRKAERKDIQELLDIYNYEVVNGVATLDLEPKTFEEWEKWFAAHNIKNHPLYVAETECGDAAVCDGTMSGVAVTEKDSDTSADKASFAAGEVAGYASLSSYREKEAYCSTVELSIYISPKYRGQKVASALMEFILEEAKRDESIHTVVSVITSGNVASSRLHEKFGFTFCGCIREVGMKFGRYLDIDNYSLRV